MFRDGGDVRGAQGVGVGVGAGFGFVADEVVPVGGGLVEGAGEELRDEGGGEGEDECLEGCAWTLISRFVRFFYSLTYSPTCSGDIG